MKKTALLLAAVLGAPFAAAHQREISAEDWTAEEQKWHAESVAPFFLVHAAAHGDLAEVKRLLDGGAVPNEKSKNGRTPLMTAIAERHADIVKMLLAAGADPNLGGEIFTPLFVAAHSGNLEVVRMLLDGGAEPDTVNNILGWTPLKAAVVGKNIEVMKVLLAAGADPTLKDGEGSAIISACADDLVDDDWEMGKIIVNNSDFGWGSYAWACAQIYLRAPEFLIFLMKRFLGQGAE